MAHPKKRSHKFKGAIAIAIGMLFLSLLAVLIAHPKNSSYQQTNTVEPGVHVSLGAMEYSISAEKAVKRTDKNVTELRSFLTKAANEDISDNCPTVYYNLVAPSTNEDQVLLNYGCGYPDARMFAVKQNGTWKFITPTNQFDTFGIPACSHVNKNHIEATIAPVCGNGMTDDETGISYEARL